VSCSKNNPSQSAVQVKLLKLTNRSLAKENTMEEKGSKESGCFVSVEDRSAATLIPIIKQWIRPGTAILSDCW